MHPISTIALLALGSQLLFANRNKAIVSLLIGCCCFTIGQGIQIGSLYLPFYRILLAIALTRIILRGERPAHGFNRIDYFLASWCVWIVFANMFHVQEPGSGTKFALGIVYNISIFYIAIRTWCSKSSDLKNIITPLSYILLIIAASMIYEQLFAKNLFSILGGISEQVNIRNGKIRSQGPFGHPILAGTVGGVAFPYFIAIINTYRKSAIIGILCSIAIVIASRSSGPLLTLALSISFLYFWKHRHLTKHAIVLSIIAYIALEVVMNRPAYYFVSHIDITGSSTAHHRAQLIEAAITHFSEWWLIGTDYTRHWLPIGLANNPNHVDVTNYYIKFATLAGFLGLFGIVFLVFYTIKRAIYSIPSGTNSNFSHFALWCITASLFTHSITSLSISYYDQSQIFFWMNIGLINSLVASVNSTVSKERPHT